MAWRLQSVQMTLKTDMKATLAEDEKCLMQLDKGYSKRPKNERRLRKPKQRSWLPWQTQLKWKGCKEEA